MNYGSFNQKKMKPCPKCNGTKGSLMTGNDSKHNPKSQLTGTQICPACYTDETIQIFLGRNKSLDTDSAT